MYPYSRAKAGKDCHDLLAGKKTRATAGKPAASDFADRSGRTTLCLQGMPRIVKNAKIACLDMNLQKARMLMGVQVLVSDPAELEKIRTRESDIIKERIQKLLDAGANVVLTSKGIDDLSLKYLVEAGVLGCRRVSKEDLRYFLLST